MTDKPMEEHDDLYGDIDDTPVFSSVADTPSTTTTTRGLDDDNVKGSSKPRSLVEQVSFLEERVGALQRENEILKRNMGTLYRTAIAELQRKDKEIVRLTTELDGTTHRKGDATMMVPPMGGTVNNRKNSQSTS
jgi:hypothetical protein